MPLRARMERKESGTLDLEGERSAVLCAMLCTHAGQHTRAHASCEHARVHDRGDGEAEVDRGFRSARTSWAASPREEHDTSHDRQTTSDDT